jgi:hypothetical protein
VGFEHNLMMRPTLSKIELREKLQGYFGSFWTYISFFIPFPTPEMIESQLDWGGNNFISLIFCFKYACYYDDTEFTRN